MSDTRSLKRIAGPLGLTMVLFVSLGWLVPVLASDRTTSQSPTNPQIPRQSFGPAVASSPSNLSTNTPTPAKGPHVVVKVGATHLRGGPGTAYRPVGIVRRSEQLTVVGQAYGCKWLKVISAKGQKGWIARSFTNFSASCALIPAAPFPPPPRKPTPNSEEPPVEPTLVLPPTPTDTPAPRGSPTPNDTPEPHFTPTQGPNIPGV